MWAGEGPGESAKAQFAHAAARCWLCSCSTHEDTGMPTVHGEVNTLVYEQVCSLVQAHVVGEKWYESQLNF